MREVTISDTALREAASEGIDAFVKVILDAIKDAAGGELTLETMSELTNEQITLWAFSIVHEEVMDGGYVQLLHNGYGEFLFNNPFLKILKSWGLRELTKQLYDARKLFFDNREDLERDCTDEEFMLLFEKYPQFDSLDDEFVENEEEYIEAIAHYIDEHIEQFVKIV